MIQRTLFSYAKITNWKTEYKFKIPAAAFGHVESSVMDNGFIKRCCLKDKTLCDNSGVVLQYHTPRIGFQIVYCMGNGELQELYDEDEDLCPVECVREIKKDEELLAVLEKAKTDNTLVVVDFYRTSCGSCKYIEQGFAKLCKGSGDEEAAVIFLKHNVIDEYDEQSDIAERLRIKTVPLFHFYKNGRLLEAFPTRDKERIKAAIEKYRAPASTVSQSA